MSDPTGYDEPARARRVPEPGKAARSGRSVFERDRARVLHSAALRRLAAKTQVVGVGVDDFPRTRLTHSLECAQIGRELAHALGADPDVVDAACLAHDLGHPPFGHNGEQALDGIAQPCGGFEGNAQSLRVLTRLEAKTLDPDGRSAGLNLTRAALDAATKYPWARRDGDRKYCVYPDDADVFEWLRADSPVGDRRCLEAQIMDWADDVAYSVHDLEDGVHADHVDLAALDDPVERAELVAVASRIYSDATTDVLAAALDGLTATPWWLHRFDGGHRAHVALKRMTSELIGRLVAAALEATRAGHGDRALRRYDADLAVPAQARAECAVLKAVTYRYVMARAGVNSAQARERAIVTELATGLLDRAPDALAAEFRDRWHAANDDAARLRAVVDQVASLTDISARAWHARLTAARP
ncbi:MAG TPA: deoxyguanosinetriphosphate triphosphohydrolase [Mycobacteriales bacterium]|nr:deoxyguanosinetriphosphate triphosphohydrolase [Mycobacteriales bacterium]